METSQQTVAAPKQEEKDGEEQVRGLSQKGSEAACQIHANRACGRGKKKERKKEKDNPRAKKEEK